MLRRVVRVACLLSVAFLLPVAGRTGINADARGECSVVAPVTTTVMINASSPNSLRMRDSYGKPCESSCSADTILTLTNEPDGPAVGDTLAASTLTDLEVRGLLGEFGRLWDTGIDVLHSPVVGIGRCDNEACARAGLFRGTAVLVLGEGSPPPAATIVTASRAPGRRRLAIPFVAARVGDDDWLEMSNRGHVFWKMPLSAIHPGELYFALVPPELIDSKPGVWTIYLNSYGARDSTIFIALPTAHRRS